MTCIVGLVDSGKVYMGGDSAGVAGLDICTRKDPKVFINGSFLVGYTSSFRMGQLLRFKLSPPKHYPDVDIYQFMVVDFVEAVRGCLKEGGYTRVNNNQETGGSFLVGYKGRLFDVAADFQVGEVEKGYTACGCGQSFALGSLYQTEGQKNPKKRVLAALSAAQEFSAGVREPFHVLEIE